MRAFGDSRYGPISDEFDKWLTQTVQSEPTSRTKLLAQWDSAPKARLCHPPKAEEHLIPLMVVAGAAASDMGTKVYSEVVMATTISGFQFG